MKFHIKKKTVKILTVIVQKIITIGVCISLSLMMNSNWIVLAEDSGIAFAGYNLQNINTIPSNWSTNEAAVSNDLITMLGADSSAVYYLNLSSIAESVDQGLLKIDFSVVAKIADEAGLDTASALVYFRSSEYSANLATVDLQRGTLNPGSGSVLTSAAAIPAGTRFIFIELKGKRVGDVNSVVFSQPSLFIRDTQDPTVTVGRNTDWTHDSVNVTLIASDTQSGIEGIYTEDGTRVSSSNSYTYTEEVNSTKRFFVLDYSGRSSEVLEVAVANIDKNAPLSAPEIMLSQVSWSKTPVTFSLSNITAATNESPEVRQYKLADGNWIDYTGIVTVSAEGQTVISARTLDAAGNASSVKTSKAYVDTIAPVISTLSFVLTQTGAKVTFIANDGSGSGVGEKRWASGVRDAAYFSANGTVLSATTFDVVSGGTYTVYAKDNVGNVTVNQLVINTYPVIEAISSQLLQENQTKETTFMISDTESSAGDLIVSAVSSDTTLIKDPICTNIDGTVTLKLIPVAYAHGGPINITVSVLDEGGNVSTFVFTVSVNSVNDAPTSANDDNYNTDEDVPLTIHPLVNDTDIDGDVLTIKSVGNVAHGSLSISSDHKSIVYTPSVGYNGTDSFTYIVTDGSLEGSAATVTIEVTEVNDAPLAIQDSITIQEDIATVIDVLANDSDIDLSSTPDEKLTILSITQPAHGTTLIQNNKVLYTPDLNWSGTDSFTYLISDRKGITSTAKVTVKVASVNDAPAFYDLPTEVTVNEDSGQHELVFTISDVETSTESLMIQVSSSNLSVLPFAGITLGGLGNDEGIIRLNYTTLLNSFGDVTLILRLSDGFIVTQQTVVIHVKSVNDAPVAVADEYSYLEDNSDLIIDMDDLILNDTDVDLDTLQFVKIDSLPTGGLLETIDAAAHTYRYLPQTNDHQEVTFTYVVTDGTVESIGTVTLSGISINDAPTLSVDATNHYVTDEDTVSTPIRFTVSDLETTAAALIITASSSDSDKISSSSIELTKGIDGQCQLLIHPNQDAFGEVTITLSVSDGQIMTQLDFTFTINPISDAPEAGDDYYYLGKDTTIKFEPLLNDRDEDKNSITLVDFTQPNHGTLIQSGNMLSYSPQEGYFGTDRFVYTISDGELEDQATVYLSVGGYFFPPVITGIANQFINEDESTQALSFSISDRDVGEVLTLSYTSSDPTLVPADDANIQLLYHEISNSYTVKIVPTANTSGISDITITVTDPNGNTDTAVFRVTVYPVDDPMIAVDDDVYLSEDTPIAFNIFANDSDADTSFDNIQILTITQPMHGHISGSKGQYTYVPEANYHGIDTFDYTATDGAGNVTATVTLHIEAINDAPTVYNITRELPNELGNESTLINALGSVFDVDGDVLYVDSLLTLPAYGSVELLSNGMISYTRTGISPLSNGADSFIVRLRDRATATGDVIYRSFTVYIGVDFPSGLWSQDVWASADEDAAPFWINLSYNNPTGAALILETASSSLGTVLAVDSINKRILFQPNPNANGSETIEYSITDASSEPSVTRTSLIHLSLNAVNDAPKFTQVPSWTIIDEDTSTAYLDVSFDDVDAIDDLIFTVYSVNADGSKPVLLASGINVERAANDVRLKLTPIANANGNSTLLLQVSDGFDSATSSFDLTVNPVNDAPTANDFTHNLQEDSSITMTVLSPNSDIDDDALSVSLPEGSTLEHGSVIVNQDNTITFTPSEDFFGEVSFVYEISDRFGATAQGVITLHVENVNDLPIFTDLPTKYIGLEDLTQEITFGVFDVDGDVLSVSVSYTVSELFKEGSISVSGSGANRKITAVPAANGFGTQTVTVTLSDGHGSISQQIEIIVVSDNDLPIAEDDNYQIIEDTGTQLNVQSNDSDIEDPKLEIIEVSVSAHGGTVVNSHDGTLYYVPAENYFGPDRFTYTVSDSHGGHASAVVTLDVLPVNDAPLALNDSVITDEDTAILIDVLGNDRDVENESLSVISAGTGSSLSENITIDQDGKIVYTPKHNRYGTDVFTYTVSDGQNENSTTTATVSVVILPINDAPEIVNNTTNEGTWTFNEDETGSFLFDISDPETDVKNLIITMSSDKPELIANTSISYSGSGTVKTAQLIPAANASGTCTIAVIVSDGTLTTTKIFNVVVQAVNDAPVIVTHDHNLNEDTYVSSIATGTDVESTQIIFSLSQQAVHGTATVLSDGSYTYTPLADFNGTDSFTIIGDDGSNAGNSVTASNITITVWQVNDAPVAVNDSFEDEEDTTITIDALANDSDIDTDVLLNADPTLEKLTLVANGFSGVDHGTVSVVDGKVVYVPSANFNGTDTFTYTVRDVTGATDTAEITVNFTPVDDAPISGNDSFTVSEDTPKVLNVLTNDDIDESTNPSVEELSITDIFTNALHGTLLISTDRQTVTYSPDANYFGSDSFIYDMTDKNGHIGQFTVTINVLSVNDAPTISSIEDVTVLEDTSGGALPFTVGDIENAPGTLIVSALSSNTTLIPNNKITITKVSGNDYTISVLPALNRSGTATITVTVKDANNATQTETYKVTVTAVNDNPVAADNAYTTNENTFILMDILANDDVDVALEGDTLNILSINDSDATSYGTFEVVYDVAAKRDKVRYTPNSNWTNTSSAIETLAYTMSDLAHNVTSSANVTITITPVNDAPVITTVNDQTILEDAADGTGLLSFRVSDEEDNDDTLNVSVTSSNQALFPLSSIELLNPTEGSDADRTIKLIPAADQNGSSVITLRVTDGNSVITETSFTITVTPVDDKPISGNDEITVIEDTPTVIDVLANDDVDTITNPLLENLMITAITEQPLLGTAVISSDAKTILYTPGLNSNADDRFDYSMITESGITAVFTVIIHIQPVNDAPVIHSVIGDHSVAEGTAFGPYGFTVTDVDDAWETLVVTASSGNQVLIPNPNLTVINLGSEDRTISGMPAGKWNGTSIITLSVKDDEGASDALSRTTFKIVVTAVNEAPVANNDMNYIINEDTTSTFNVLGNDTDGDLLTNPATESITIVSIAGVDNGVATIVDNGKKISFKPNLNWNGTEQFTYTISDSSGLSSTATVQVKVNGRNDAAVLVDDTAETNEDTVVLIDALANDSDVDMNVLLNLDPFANPLNENITITANGFASVDHGTVRLVGGKIEFTPEADWNGIETFTYTVTDTAGLNVTASVSVTVVPINDGPTATDDSVESDEDTEFTIHVLNNDSDIDLDSAKNAIITDKLTVTIKQIPLHGTVRLSGNDVIYTALADWNGTETFEYTLSDQSGLTSDATVTVKIDQVNDGPTANSDTSVTDEDTSISIDVLSNDTDIDLDSELNIASENEKLTIVADGFSGVRHGTVSIVDNKVVFEPENDFNGTVTFTYTVSDVSGATDTAEVSIVVNAINDGPIAVNDTAESTENKAVTIDVLANDSDIDMDAELNVHPDSDNITIVADGFTNVAHGTVAIDNGKVIFTPDLNWNGTETFGYTIIDSFGIVAEAPVTVHITNINNAPVAQADSTSTLEDTAVLIDALNNDTDIDQDVALNAQPGAEILSLVSEGFSGVDHGTVSIVGGKIRFVPSANWNGTETFTYTVRDVTGATDIATVTINVQGVNDAPVSVNNTVSTAEDTTIVIDVLANDSDVDTSLSLNTDPAADPLNESISIVADGFANVSHGTVSVVENKIQFVPETNYTGIITFTYTIRDVAGLTSSASVILTVTPVNDAPVAVNDTANTNEDSAVIVSVLLNDTDVDLSASLNFPVSEVLTVTVLSGPSHGATAVVGTTIRYTPSANYNGSDSFTYTLKDKAGLTSTATVNVSVKGINDSPTSVADTSTTQEDTAVTVDVLANDTDVDTNVLLNLDPLANPANETKTLVAGGFTLVTHGTVTVVDNKAVFTPEANFNGTGSFKYTIADKAGLTKTATATITITQVNDGPQAINDTTSTAEDNAVTIDVLANDTDVDKSATLNATPAAEILSLVSGGFSGVDHGTASIVAGKVVFTPEANYNGVETFSYTMRDVSGVQSSASITITINAVNDGPVALNDSALTLEDTPILIDVLTNDSDIDTDSLLNSSPLADHISIDPSGFTPDLHGVLSVSNGKVLFTPQKDYNGTAVFKYTVSDVSGTKATATVTVTITAVNDDPIANSDSVITNEDTAIVIDAIANDSDVDLDPTSEFLTIDPSGFSGVEHGSITIVDNKIVFTPVADFNGTETFTYTLSDSANKTATASVTITIGSVNDAPVAVDDEVTVDENETIFIDALKNDSDVDTDIQLNEDPDLEALSITADGFIGLLNGTVKLTENGIEYTPKLHFNGTETFTYTISDASGVLRTATIRVKVNNVNDVPIAQADVALTSEDHPVTIDVLNNDSDTDMDLDLNEDPASEFLTIDPNGFNGIEHGIITIIDNKIVYTPDLDLNGEEIFTYTVKDVSGTSAIAQVTVTVSARNDAPVGADDTGETEENKTIVVDVLNNDTDVDADPLLNVDPDTIGLTIVKDGISGVEHGSVTIIDNKISYIPDLNWNGTEQFTYTLSDSDGATHTADVTILVRNVNNTPLAMDDQAETDEDTVITIDVLENDSDIDMDPQLNNDPTSEFLTIDPDGFSGVEHGSVKIIDGRLVFTPEKDYNGTVEFTYKIIDATGVTAEATVVLVINAIDDAPVAENDAITIDEDTTALIDVLKNDHDIDLDPQLNQTIKTETTAELRIIEDGFSGIEHGSVTLVDQMVVFTPDADWNGIEIFTYTIEDSTGLRATAEISITINPINDAPVAQNDNVTTSEESAVVIDVLANDVDVDRANEGDGLTIITASSVKNCKVRIAADGKSLTFTPIKDFNGPVAFFYTVRDQFGIESTAEVRVVVQAVNDVPGAPILLSPEIHSSYKDTQIVHVTWTPAIDLDQTPVVYHLYFYDGTKWILLSDDIRTTFYDHVLVDTQLETDQAMYRIEAWDKVSHTDDLGEPFTIDNAAPVRVTVSLMCKTKVIQTGEKCASAAQLSISGGSDLSAFTYQYSLKGSDEWKQLSEAETVSFANSGTYDVIVRAVDTLGNTYETMITIDVQKSALVNLANHPEWPLGFGGMLLLLLLLWLFRPVRIEYSGINRSTNKTFKRVKRRYAFAPKRNSTLRLDVTYRPNNVDIHAVNVKFKPLFTRTMRDRFVEVNFSNTHLGTSAVPTDQTGRWDDTYAVQVK